MDIFAEMNRSQRPEVEKYPWMEKVTMELVTADSLPLVIDACIEAALYGNDLETTGLDTRVFNGKTVDSIVGICLAPSVDEGYYIPLRHMVGEDETHSANLPISLVNKEILRLVRSGSVAVFHNGKYDTECLEFNGGDAWGHWDKPSQWHDSMILAQLRNSRELNKGLKVLSKRDLGREMIELKQLFPEGQKDFNFSQLDPNWGPTIWYACADPMCTLGLANKYLPEVNDSTKKHNQAPIYAIEKACVAATRWMERNRLPIDRELVVELIKIGQRDYMAAMGAVYASASEILSRDVRPAYFRLMEDEGFDPDDPANPIIKQIEDAKRKAKINYGFGVVEKAGKEYPEVYDVKSQGQIGKMFEEMQVPGLKYTEKSKQVKTSADELDRVIDSTGDRFPFMAKIKRFRENEKALSTYLIPLFRDSGDDGTLRVDFEAHKTDTGRFSTPGRNEQRMGSLHGGTSYFLQGTPSTYDPDRPECMKRIRECFITRNVSDPEAIRQILEAGGFDVNNKRYYKKIFMGIDFSGVELRLVTNLSKEPKWVKEFFRCGDCGTEYDHTKPTPPFCTKCQSDKIGDLHSQTAMSLYGAESRKRENWKFLRQLSKCVHPDSLIALEGDLRTIGTLSFGDPNVFHPISGNVWSGQHHVGHRQILETYNGGTKPLFHVVTRRGILTCSDQHKFVLADGTLRSVGEGLSEGDLLKEAHAPVDFPEKGVPSDIWYKSHKDVPEVTVCLSPEVAYFAGLFAGDGYKCGKNSVGISHGDIKKTDALGVSYENWQQMLAEACRAAGFTATPREQGLYLGCRQVMRYLGALELIEGGDDGHKKLRIPRWVLQSGKDTVLHYLGGLFDTDGCVQKRDGTLSVTTKDAVFAGQITAVIHALGATPYAEPCYNKTYERWYYRVRVHVGDCAYIGKYMRHPGKIKRIKPGVQARRKIANKVLKILPAGDGPCVDLHINSEDHLYWVNGLITHNSINFALCYGGGGSAVRQTFSKSGEMCSKEEGWRIKNQFDKAYPTLKRWWAYQHEFARQHKYVLTAFGRKYPLPDIDSEEGFFRSKAERNAVNGPIQGCLHPDCRIVSHLGMKKVVDLWDRQEQGGLESLQVWDGRNWQPGRILHSGVKRLAQTVLGSGRHISTSPEHLFRVWAGKAQEFENCFDWIRQDDLTPDSWVAVDHTSVELPTPYYEWDTEDHPQEGHLFSKGMTPHNYKRFKFSGNSVLLWEFLGLIYGDGSIGQKMFTLHIGESDLFDACAFANSYADKLNTVLGVGATVYKQERPSGSSKRPLYQIKVCGKEFRAFCREKLGVLDQNTYTKRVPEALWSELVENRAAFLRGYFSADGSVSATGDMVSVRSVNEGLLADTQALLHSIGIRASWTPRCLRVTVLDRLRFQQLVGFVIPHKTTRLGNMKVGGYLSQWHRLPKDLIRWVGGVVYASTVYAALPRPQKSAVLRLKVGSGSKPQCLRYLALLPKEEIPGTLLAALGYDYELVASTEDTGESVDMYDVEVFNEDHAFVCDGIVVHNSSADLTKASMALIFKEFQKRDWLEKCMMTITMHDELCFECDGDIFEEAIAVISEIMSNNSYLRRKKWPIHLPVDVEVGPNWNVQWNYTKIANGQAKCPEELRPFINLDRPNTDNGGGGDGDKGEGRQPVSHRVKDMSEKTRDALVEVILGSQDDGGVPLVLVSPKGDEMNSFMARQHVVDPSRFKSLAKDYEV